MMRIIKNTLLFCFLLCYILITNTTETRAAKLGEKCDWSWLDVTLEFSVMGDGGLIGGGGLRGAVIKKAKGNCEGDLYCVGDAIDRKCAPLCPSTDGKWARDNSIFDYDVFIFDSEGKENVQNSDRCLCFLSDVTDFVLELEGTKENQVCFGNQVLSLGEFVNTVDKEQREKAVNRLSKFCEGGAQAKKYTYKNWKGKTVTDYYCVGITGEYIGGMASGCKTVAQQIKEEGSCFFCPLFVGLYNAADNMSHFSFKQVGRSFALILITALAVWIAFATLSHVGSFSKQDGPKYLGNTARESFKVLIAFFMLMNSGHVYYYVVNPLINAGLTMGTKLLNTAIDNNKTYTNAEAISKHKLTFYSSLEKYIVAIQTKVSVMQAIGKNLICVGSNNLFSLNFNRWGSAFYMVIQGCIIAAFALLISLAFAFFVIDAVVQIGIVGGLMPFLILCWPFKLTSKYTGKGFDILVNSCFVFIFMSIAINIDFALIGYSMSQNVASVDNNTGNCGTYTSEVEEDGKKVEKTIDVPCNGFFAIWNAINTSDWEKLAKLTDLSGMQFLILLACAIFGFKFVAQASGLAGQMAGGAIKGIGSSIGTMAASAIKSGSSKVLGGVAEGTGLKKMADNVGDKVKNFSKNAVSGVAKAPFKAVKYAVNKNYRNQVNQKVSNKLKTSEGKKNAKALAKQVGGDRTGKDEDGNRIVSLNGASANVDINGKISGISSNVTKKQNSDGSFSYTDSKTGKSINEKEAQKREAAANKLRVAAGEIDPSSAISRNEIDDKRKRQDDRREQ